MVLDYRENIGCDTGRFELIHHDTTNPNTRGLDSKLLLEGQRIRKPDLQRYMIIDQKAMKIEKDREEKAKERERRRSKAEAENRAREERERVGAEGNTNNSNSDSAAVDSGCEVSSTINTPLRQSPVEGKSGEFTPEEKLDILASLQASTLPEIGNKKQDYGVSKPPRDKQSSRFSLRSSIVEIYGGGPSSSGKSLGNGKSKTSAKTERHWIEKIN